RKTLDGSIRRKTEYGKPTDAACLLLPDSLRLPTAGLSRHPAQFPNDELAHSLLERHLRLVVEQPPGFGQVGTGDGHVAGLLGLVFDLGRLADRLFERGDHRAHGDWIGVAEVDRFADDVRIDQSGEKPGA